MKEDRRQGLAIHHEACRMPELGGALILDTCFSSDTDLLSWEWLLRVGANDMWVKAGDKAVVAAPSPVPIPRVQIFAQLDEYALQQHQGQLIYCIIVQGKEGAALAKLVLKEDVGLLGSQLYFEAANGYNVVFTGVLKKKDYQRLAGSGLSLRRVEEIDDLLLEEPPTSGYIPIWC